MTRVSGRTPAAFFLAGAFAVFLLPISNPDIYWHLSAGRFMAERFAWPRVDWLSHTRLGAPWFNFEWGVQVFWYVLWRIGGFTALWAAKAALFTGCAAVLWRVLGLYLLSETVKGALIFFWALAVLPANDLRPENFSVFLFLVLIGVLEKNRLEKTRLNWKSVFVFFLVWANLHAGFIYGLGLAALYVGTDCVRSRSPGGAPALAAGAAGALVNPYGWSVYGVLYEHWAAREGLQNYIKEWQSAAVTDFWLWPFWTALASVFFLVLSRFIKKRDVPYAHLAAISVFALSASAHVRTSVYFSCLAAVFAACVAAKEAPRFSKKTKTAFVLLTAGGALFFAINVVPVLRRANAVTTNRLPVRLVQYLDREKKTLSGNVLFNPWEWGGYLGFYLFPDYRVFMDGRYVFHDYLGKTDSARKSPAAYEAFLDGNGIETVVVKRTGQLLPVEVEAGGRRIRELRPFYLFYLPPSRWALVYWDSLGLTFVRRKSVPYAWLQENEYRFFRPGDWHDAARRSAEESEYHAKLGVEIERHFLDVVSPGERQDALRWWRSLRK